MVRLMRDLAWAFVVALAISVIVAVGGADLVRILLSFLVVFVAFAVGLTYIDHRRSKVRNAAIEAGYLDPAPTPPRGRVEPRLILDLTPAQVVRFAYSPALTDLQREQKLESDYTNKWIRVSGEVEYVRTEGQHVIVTIDQPNAVNDSPRNRPSMLRVEAFFDPEQTPAVLSLVPNPRADPFRDPEEIPAVLRDVPGDRVVILGQISDLKALALWYRLTLTNCEFVHDGNTDT